MAAIVLFSRGSALAGLDGAVVAGGRSASAVADTKEPFAWAISSDNKTVVGADMDGYFLITLVSPDRMDKCYVHNAVGGGKSVVATCYTMDRKR